MLRFPRATLIFGAAVALTTLSYIEVRAGAFAVREQSAIGQGMAFAGEGVSDMGLSAMFWNPAAVTVTKGVELESDLSGVFTNSTIDTFPATSPSLLALGSKSI